jgi:hypothetical protein
MPHLKTAGCYVIFKHKIQYPNTNSCKVSLKAVLLHDANKHPPVPPTHAVHLKETYANIQSLLENVYRTIKKCLCT